ncbi:MAG: hypothetical protein K6A41_04530 [Bacteroidales bacterium]|nr:hypothetical protein [Bacteroidales bacterium]
MEKVKIVLDADVLIHFSKGEMLSILPEILPEYEFVILSTTYDEIISIRNQVDNQIRFLKNLSLETFSPTGEMLREYALLLNRFGKGESACMAYCKFTRDVIGSSNLKDIKEYCQKEKITYLTTLDFLYYAYVRGKITTEHCSQFIAKVNERGSRLLVVDISSYVPSAQL